MWVSVKSRMIAVQSFSSSDSSCWNSVMVCWLCQGQQLAKWWRTSRSSLVWPGTKRFHATAQSKMMTNLSCWMMVTAKHIAVWLVCFFMSQETVLTWCMQWRNYHHACLALPCALCRGWENWLFINGNFACASSRTQRDVSLSSAEPELHSMVSGCSDAIFLKRCMEFLTGDQVEQWQWVDNSAARQLIERQGVGKVRHLSGKILWMQTLVLEKQIHVGQIVTQWNVSDIGTKPLPKQRLLVLLHQIGACNPDTLSMVGQEELDAFEERVVGQQSMKRLTRAVSRMAAMWGLEPILHVGAEASGTEEVCLQGQASGNDSGDFWLWLALSAIFLLWICFAVAGYLAWRKVSRDLFHCWKQVADEDGNISMQEKRIDELVQKIERMQTQMEQDYAMLSDRVETTSNADSMTHDYATGLHYSLVEHGGFLGNGCGLRQAQWIHLTTLERTNLISARTLGSVEYMRLVRQRFTPQSISEETDDGPFEGAESEAMEHDGIIESPAGANSVTNIVEFLKSEHLQCLEHGGIWDANLVQNTILGFLDEIRTENAREMLGRCKERVAAMFDEMYQKAVDQNRWETADHYHAVANIYRNGWVKIFFFSLENCALLQIQKLEGSANEHREIQNWAEGYSIGMKSDQHFHSYICHSNRRQWCETVVTAEGLTLDDTHKSRRDVYKFHPLAHWNSMCIFRPCGSKRVTLPASQLGIFNMFMNRNKTISAKLQCLHGNVAV